MRHMARKRGQDEELWGLIDLVHDLDYEKFPDPPWPPLKLVSTLSDSFVPIARGSSTWIG